MLKIRLMRIGAKKRPFYRVVVVDEREKRTGKYIELLGTYNPLTEPKEIKLEKARVEHWIKQGAQPSDGYLRMIGKAPQRPPRKPKKEKVSETKPAEEPAKEGVAKSTDNQKEQVSETSDTPVSSDSSDTPSPSVPTESGNVSSEKESETK